MLDELVYYIMKTLSSITRLQYTTLSNYRL